jgi:hypothetical protein
MTFSVPIMATGSTGTPASSTMRATPGAAAVQPRVGAAGALGVDAEDAAVAEHPEAGREATPRTALPPERSMGSCPAAWKKSRVAQPLRPLPVKYSLFGEEDHSAVDDERQEDRVDEGEVVRREHDAPSLGTCSSPTTQGRKIARRIGPMTMCFMIQ